MSSTPGPNYIVMTNGGLGRSATTWLKNVIDSNLRAKMLVTHDGFHENPAHLLDRWHSVEDDVDYVIDFNTPFEVVPKLVEQFDTKVVILVRRPIDWTRTFISRMKANAPKTYSKIAGKNDNVARVISFGLFRLFSMLDNMIRFFRREQLPYNVWHMSYFTKPEGLRAMMASVGIELPKKLKLDVDRHSMKKDKKLKIAKWVPEAEIAEKRLLHHFAYAHEAYMNARIGS